MKFLKRTDLKGIARWEYAERYRKQLMQEQFEDRIDFLEPTHNKR